MEFQPQLAMHGFVAEYSSLILTFVNRQLLSVVHSAVTFDGVIDLEDVFFRCGAIFLRLVYNTTFEFRTI